MGPTSENSAIAAGAARAQACPLDFKPLVWREFIASLHMQSHGGNASPGTLIKLSVS